MIPQAACLILILLISGCAANPKAHAPLAAIVTASLDAVPQLKASVVNPQVFDKGGSLVLGSFQAGEGAFANDQTDRLSMMIAKGIQDAFPQGHSPFVLQTDHQAQPDYFLEGTIENFGQGHLSIDGNIWSRVTGEKIFLFQSSSVINLKTQDPNVVAYQMGLAIAQHLNKE